MSAEICQPPTVTTPTGAGSPEHRASPPAAAPPFRSQYQSAALMKEKGVNVPFGLPAKSVEEVRLAVAASPHA